MSSRSRVSDMGPSSCEHCRASLSHIHRRPQTVFGSAARTCYRKISFGLEVIAMPEPVSAVRVAVVGIGAMGFGMATALKRAGFDVAGCDVAAGAVERLVALGGLAAATPADAARGAAIVVSVVVNAAQTEAILFGKDGIAETLAPGAVFVSSATMAPETARDLAKRLEATGRHF